MQTSEHASDLGWARPWATARPFAKPTPRTGAWYPIVAQADDQRVVLEIRGKRVAVLRRLLEIRPDRPSWFSAVVRARGAEHPAAGTPQDLGRVYAVCPSCGARVRVSQDQVLATCPDCGHRGEIAWWDSG